MLWKREEPKDFADAGEHRVCSVAHGLPLRIRAVQGSGVAWHLQALGVGLRPLTRFSGFQALPTQL